LVNGFQGQIDITEITEIIVETGSEQFVGRNFFGIWLLKGKGQDSHGSGLHV
jgi:hypothetical protein